MIENSLGRSAHWFFLFSRTFIVTIKCIYTKDHPKRKKIKVKTQVYSYSEKNKKVILLKFTSNSPREAEGLRRRWIRHNLENWTKRNSIQVQ